MPYRRDHQESTSEFSDAEETVTPKQRTEKKRQRSMGEMIKSLEHKRIRTEGDAPQRDVSSEFLGEIKTVVENSIESAMGKLWEKMELKLSGFNNRIEILESGIFDRDLRIDQLEKKLQSNEKVLMDQAEQLEELERHSRQSNLIIECDSLGRRRPGENIEATTIGLLKERFPEKSMAKHDFSAIHRLQGDRKVICAFTNRNLRNAIYEDRMRQQKTDGPALFVRESLTKAKQGIFAALLKLRREGKIWTAFTNSGIPAFKLTPESAPTRIHSLQQLDALMGMVPSAGKYPVRRAAGAPPRPADPMAGAPSGSGRLPSRASAAAPGSGSTGRTFPAARWSQGSRSVSTEPAVGAGAVPRQRFGSVEATPNGAGLFSVVEAMEDPMTTSGSAPASAPLAVVSQAVSVTAPGAAPRADAESASASLARLRSL